MTVDTANCVDEEVDRMRSRRSVRSSVAIVGVMGLALAVAVPVSARDSTRSGPAASVSPAASIPAPNRIGFDADGMASKPDPFTSRDNPTVHFVDSVNANLQVANFDPQSNGLGLAVFSDDASALVILLDVPTKRLALVFGNDEPGATAPGDRATLAVFRDGQRIARRHVTMNRNDIGDQTIEYRGRVAIDRATLVYNRDGAPIDVTEVVDDIALTQVCALSGNRRGNTLNGNASPNGICGRNGRDRIFGHGGNDALFGDGGDDRVHGNDGNDLVVGGSGNDTLEAADGVPGNDAVYGGPGIDTCTTDVGDLVVGCENSVVVPTGSGPSARRR
jgi:hypothetical protein